MKSFSWSAPIFKRETCVDLGKRVPDWTQSVRMDAYGTDDWLLGFCGFLLFFSRFFVFVYIVIVVIFSLKAKLQITL